MTTIQVHINGREFHLACDPGQEELLVALSQEVDDRVRQLSRQIPQAGEPMLLLLAAVMLADELSDEKRQVHELKSEIYRLRELTDEDPAGESQARLMDFEAAMAETLKEVTARIESIAEKLELG